MRGARVVEPQRSSACAVPGAAGPQDRAVGLAGTNAIRALRLEQIAAEAADRRLRVDAEQLRGLGIQVADVAVAIHREHALDDSGEHALGLGLAPAQRAGEIHQVAAHVFHGARQRADLGGAPDRNRGREVALAEAHGRRGEILHRPGDELAEHGAGQHRQQRQHQRRDQQAMDERADLTVDLRRRQARLDQRDDLAGIGEQREARRVQIELLDMRHGVATIGKAGAVQAGQLHPPGPR